MASALTLPLNYSIRALPIYREKKDMRYFTVEKEVMNVAPTIYPVNASGEQSADAWERDFVQEIATGFCVNDLSEEVLEQIKKDYPPTEWQNNEW